MAAIRERMMGFGRELKRIMEEKGASQYWLAKATGITREGLRMLMKDNRVPSWDTVLLIADALEVTPDAFLSEDDPKAKERFSTRVQGTPGRKPKSSPNPNADGEDPEEEAEDHE